MTESDAACVSHIVSDGYADMARQEGFSCEQAERLLSERSTVSDICGWLSEWNCFVIESDAGVVGALAIDRKDIGELWIHAGHHRQGLGSALFHKAEQVIADAGFRELTVRCAAAGVHGFYVAMGCVVVGIKPCLNGPLTGRTLTDYRKKLTGDSAP